MEAVLEVKHIKKSYDDIKVLVDFSLEVKKQEFVGIKGASGAGKSTLLNILGLLDTQDEGDMILFQERNVKPFSRKAEKLLKHKIGYLFQNFALLDNETVYKNMYMAIAHHSMEQKQEKIAKALEEVGLAGYEQKKICECSGGEQQRIAIARLLIKPCELILADEPTGSLDVENKKIVFQLLKKLQEMGKTLVVVTHDEELLEIVDRVIEISKVDR